MRYKPPKMSVFVTQFCGTCPKELSDETPLRTFFNNLFLNTKYVFKNTSFFSRVISRTLLYLIYITGVNTP